MAWVSNNGCPRRIRSGLLIVTYGKLARSDRFKNEYCTALKKRLVLRMTLETVDNLMTMRFWILSCWAKNNE